MSNTYENGQGKILFDGEVTSIGEDAFENSSSLTSVEIPNSVTTIGSSAFYRSRLISIEIPNSVTSIGNGAFMQCRYMTSVELPNSVTTIGESAFNGCFRLTSVVIPNSVTSIGWVAFSRCSSLTSVVIPNSVTLIEDGAFNGCLSLTEVVIPNSVISIGREAFRYCIRLTSVVIPNSVTNIWGKAFMECRSLTSVTCLAETPPRMFEDTFAGINSDAILYVLPESIEDYNKSNWAESFNVLKPLISSGCSIEVNLLDNWKDGRYKDMILELTEKGNEKQFKIVVSDKDSYTFSGVSEGSYCLRLMNSWGDVLGEIETIEVNEGDVTVSFENLRQPKSVALSVLTPDGEDVTEKVVVSWLRESGELMKQGASIAGVLVGSEIAYSIALPDDLLAEYVCPAKQSYTISETDNKIQLMLEPIGKTMLAGVVCDENGKALPYATVTISPLINGKYGNSVTAITDAKGQYEVEVPNVPCKVTVSSNGYVCQTVELQSATDGLGQISLEKTSGLTLSVTTDYSDQANVAYRALDGSENELEGCIYQGSSIVLPKSVGIGDELTVVAYSKNGKFKDVVQNVVLDSKNTYIEIPIVEYGSLDVKCEGDGYGCIAILYNNVGEQVARTSFSEGVATFVTVPDGSYSVVTMKKFTLFNSVLNISALGGAGLSQGADYLQASATLESGKVAEVALGAIPALDETKLLLATGDGTYFMPGKAELTISNYQVLKAKVDLKDEYLGKAKDAVLVVDIPSSCEFVDNSVLSGKNTFYQKDGNRIRIPVDNIEDLVRFCIIPLEAGEIRPSAMVQMTIDGNAVVLPMGSAYFEAKNFSLAAVEKTSKTTIALRGTATKNSEVLIYDNETLVGKTTSLANGQWTTNISFAKPYSHSFHEIYGEVLTTDGKRLLTETKLAEYDKSYVDVEKVTMLYGSYKIDFDPTNGKTSNGYYSYAPGSPDFTFTADFSNNDPSLISNLTFKVLASDGTTRTLEGTYNETTGNWVASSKYPYTQKLPVNVKVEYDVMSEEIDDNLRTATDYYNICRDIEELNDELQKGATE